MDKNKKIALIEKMYLKHYKRLVNYLMKFFNNREISKDVVSRAFLQAIENIDKFDPDIASFSTWLYTIAKNEALQELYLSNKKMITVSIDADKNNYMSFEKKINTNIISDLSDHINYYNRRCVEMFIINKKLKIIIDHTYRLEEKYKDIIIMKCFKKMSYRQISKKLNLNMSTVKSRYRFAKRLLIESAKNDLKMLENTDIYDIIDEYLYE